MTMMRSKIAKALLKRAARSMRDVEIPYIHRKRSSSVMPYVLGAIGVAVAGGIAAVMIFSPRTRYKAIGKAKDVYGKAKDEVDHLRGSTPLSNGLSGA